ncbi:MAG: type II secretion system ATPase GspE [Pseudomonadota bacterium]
MHEYRRAEEERLGQFLLDRGKLVQEELSNAMQLQGSTGEPLSYLLIKLGLVSEVDMAEALANLLSLSIVEEKEYLNVIPFEENLSTVFLKEHNVLPLALGADDVSVALADPLDRYAINAISLFFQKRVSCRVGQAAEIQAAIERIYGSGKTQMARIVEDIAPAQSGADQQEIAHLKDIASEAPVIRLVSLIMQHAVDARASDIHIEPFESRLKVRYRIDGILHEEEAPPMPLYAALVSRIKIMSNLDIAERRLPQDGRFMSHIDGQEIDVRVSTVPTMHGESLVLRLLYKDYAMLNFQELGFEGNTYTKFIDVLHKPYGVLLVTGPTGSGKTTTLYAALNVLNETGNKLLTVEDPVEYQIEGINQIQVKPHIGLSFAKALRSIVRQDPDIIMIGEMRDLETAEIAVQSALTGHLVLSTLHTNDAASSITRLMDMGIADYLVTSVVNGVLGQRLVRRLCPVCRKAYEPLPELIEKLHLNEVCGDTVPTLYQPVGCEQCSNTGYRGRIALLEMLVLSDRIRSLILQHSDAREIARVAAEEGMQTMYQDGLHKLVQGMTSVAEVLRETRDK